MTGSEVLTEPVRYKPPHSCHHIRTARKGPSCPLLRGHYHVTHEALMSHIPNECLLAVQEGDRGGEKDQNACGEVLVS